MKQHYCIFFIKEKLTPKMINSSVVVTSNKLEYNHCIKEVRDMHLSFDMLPVRKCNRNRIALLLGEVKSIS